MCTYSSLFFPHSQGDVQELTEFLREDVTNPHVQNSFFVLFFFGICIYITYIYMQGDMQELTESLRKDITNSHVQNSFSLLFFFKHIYM